MRVLRHPPPDLAHVGVAGSVVALGNFDGVHGGHRAVIGAAGDLARREGRPWGVMTFEPHPRQMFRPDDAPFRLTPAPLKLALIRAMGVDFAVVVRFDRALAALSADAFVDRWLIHGLAVSDVVVGHDFCFGQGRGGDPALLVRRGGGLPRAKGGFGVVTVPPQMAPTTDLASAPELYSSTAIRRLLAAGSPEAAAALLGRPHRIEGRVRHGDARGRTLGFPTANLSLGPSVRPRVGVYAINVIIGGARYDGVANIGVRPTVGGADMRLEAHVFDFTGDLYGQRIAVDLISFLRPEMKFSGLAELTQRIAVDCADARARLAAAA
jgi:riboflavin kinase / FMN adenylyltransferase